ncbi:hypothetical protein F5141DRAFT_1205685 [Pisolithus sp. B1]|nr:hypothetical protein F5141DRAFT_1205685 [Pisolithus sp. B1]
MSCDLRQIDLHLSEGHRAWDAYIHILILSDCVNASLLNAPQRLCTACPLRPVSPPARCFRPRLQMTIMLWYHPPQCAEGSAHISGVRILACAEQLVHYYRLLASQVSASFDNSVHIPTMRQPLLHPLASCNYRRTQIHLLIEPVMPPSVGLIVALALLGGLLAASITYFILRYQRRIHHLRAPSSVIHSVPSTERLASVSAEAPPAEVSNRLMDFVGEVQVKRGIMEGYFLMDNVSMLSSILAEVTSQDVTPVSPIASTDMSTPPTVSSSRSSDSAVIIGSSVGATVFLCFIAIVTLLCLRFRRRRFDTHGRLDPFEHPRPTVSTVNRTGMSKVLGGQRGYDRGQNHTRSESSDSATAVGAGDVGSISEIADISSGQRTAATYSPSVSDVRHEEDRSIIARRERSRELGKLYPVES